MNAHDPLPLLADDPHDRRLVSHVHPADWRNPVPQGRYNLVVIGGGTAGLVSAAGAAGLGAKVALVERQFLGGDCLNTGCVPSKALLRAARSMASIREAAGFGIRVPEGTVVDFEAVMGRLRRLRADISHHDSAQRFTSLGVDVYLGSARFTGPDAVEVAGQSLRFSRAVIATGARAARPRIPGLETVPYLTNETLFNLTRLPTRLGIIGAGPIGCEMAQAFARLGSRVFLLTSSNGLLPKEDPDAAQLVRIALQRDGVQILGGGRELEVSAANPGIHLRSRSSSNPFQFEVDELLVAVGRTPNVENLGLESAGVKFSAKGVTIDDRLRTSNPRIYACGDVCSDYQFTHAADFMARTVLQNALFHGRARLSSLVIPRCTYTTPEVAEVGLSLRKAQEQGIPIDSFTQQLTAVDRAILDGETEGFVRVHVRKGSDRILGATVVATHAGELINEITLAIRTGTGLGRLASTIHPYPTQADAIRKTGDLYNRTRLTPFVQGLMARWLRFQR